MLVVFRYFWLIAMAITFLNGAMAWRKARPDIVEHPEKAESYRRLVRGWMLWGNLGWAVMGTGILSGGTHTMLDYLYQRDNHWVLAWYATNIAVSLLGILWVFRMGGAEQLAAHPVFFRQGGSNVSVIRLYVALSLVAGIVCLVLLYLDVIPIPPAGTPLL